MKKFEGISCSSFLCALFLCAGLFASCASPAKKTSAEKIQNAAAKNASVEIAPANEIQRNVDNDLRPVFAAAFGDVKIASAVSSDNVDSGIGGWLNYFVKQGIDRNKVQLFEKGLQKQGYVVAQDIITEESGRLLFNMIAIKETADIDYNLSIGTLQDEENVISVFATIEKSEGAVAPKK